MTKQQLFHHVRELIDIDFKVPVFNKTNLQKAVPPDFPVQTHVSLKDVLSGLVDGYGRIHWNINMSLAPRDGTPILVKFKHNNGLNPKEFQREDFISMAKWSSFMWVAIAGPDQILCLTAVGWEAYQWARIY